MTPALSVAGIDHVVLRVRDTDRALAFYETVLGCRLEKRNDAVGLLHLRAGDSLIDLIPLDGALGRRGGAGPAAEGRNVDHICLRIRGYEPEAVAAHLDALDIPFEAPAMRYGAGGEGMSIYIQDPDGNGIELRG